MPANPLLRCVILLPSAEEQAAETEEAVEVERDPRTAWYVIHTYSGYENKVRDDILRRVKSMNMVDKIFQVLVPTEEELEFKDGKKKTVQRRVYPGYVFVEMIMSDDSWYVVRNTRGVTGFVSPNLLRKISKNYLLNLKQSSRIFSEIKSPLIHLAGNLYLAT